MEAYLLEWAALLLRWTHVVVAIAWIGASFYFVFLDNNLTPPVDGALKSKGVTGELWAVHGGGFYNPQKYLPAPPTLPAHMHWFYWESYATWLSGFALYTVVYLFNASTFLVDKRVYDWSSGSAAGLASIGFLLAFWLIYDALCRTLGQKKNGDALVGVGVLAAVVLGSALACQLFAGRAAFVLVGAMMATAMSANVLVWIIPGQRTVIAQHKGGQPVDPIHGWRGKQRSVHNTYFTLPVLVAMLSNHYGWLTGAPHNWALLVALMLAGALVRHSFVARHQALLHSRRVPWEFAALGVVLIGGVVAALAPAPQAPVSAQEPAPNFAQVQAVVTQRCVVCHNAQVANKGVVLDTAQGISQHAQAIYHQAVVLQAMPMNNATGITPEERALLGRWFTAGAKGP